MTGSLLSRLFGHREDYVLATKVYFPMGIGPNDGGLSRKHIMSAIDASLSRDRTAADFDVADRVAEVAAERGVPSAQVALAWLLHKPVVTAPIIGATKLRHIEDALASEHFALSEEEISRLEEKYVPHPILGHS